MVIIKEIQAQKILSPTSIDLAEYVINPYKGCEFGCLHCYAKENKQMKKRSEFWGGFVDVKINAPELLEKEILVLKPKSVLIGSTTEPFQPVEKKYQLTQKILEILAVARKFLELGFNICATRGTAEFLKAAGIGTETVLKVIEGSPNVTDEIRAGKIQLVINTPTGAAGRADDYSIRRTALVYGILRITTVAAARAICSAIEALQKEKLKVKAIQEYF